VTGKGALIELALMTEPQMGGSYQQLLALTRWAEEIGFDAFARSDHYLDGERSAPVTDALASLAGLARDTTSIQLVVLVTPLTFRHPAVIAKTAVTIDEMSAGRLGLGVGTVWMESEHRAFGMDLHSLGERFDRFEETLGYVRASFSGAGGFSGRHYALEAIEVLPRPVGPLPIIVGGGGMRRTPSLAGRFADEYNMFACERDVFEQRVAVMRDAALEAGRNPDDIAVSIATNTLVAPTDAEFEDLIAAKAARKEMSPDEYRSHLRAHNLLHGTPEEAADGIERLRLMGVSRVYLQEFSSLGDVETEKLAAVVAAARR